MKSVNLVTLTILIIGGFNWGMVSWLGEDLVSFLVGSTSLPGRLIYLTFAFAALYQLLPLWLSFRMEEPVVQADAF